MTLSATKTQQVTVWAADGSCSQASQAMEGGNRRTSHIFCRGIVANGAGKAVAASASIGNAAAWRQTADEHQAGGDGVRRLP